MEVGICAGFINLVLSIVVQIKYNNFQDGLALLFIVLTIIFLVLDFRVSKYNKSSNLYIESHSIFSKKILEPVVNALIPS